MSRTNIHLSKTETYTLTTLCAGSVAVLVQTIRANGAPLIASLALSVLAFSVSYAWIRWTGELFINAGRKGKDMSKKHGPIIPETMGAISAAVFLLAMALFMPFGFYRELLGSESGAGSRDVVQDLNMVDTGRFLHRFPHDKIEQYYSAGWSLAFMFILGLADDIFDIRWRHKIWIPFFASIPLLLTYYGNFGVTDVVVPTVLRPYLGDLIRLGWLYYAYMACLSTFAPNCINIFAGINGIEVGQSIVIALLIVANDLFYLVHGGADITRFTPSAAPANPSAHNTNARQKTNPASDAHLFSLYLLLPFLGVSFSLLIHNWYPARVFVGDTYCYFAGMLIAVDAILNHFSKTLLLLLIPQVFNFLYSAPQLFGLVPCPRHRLPKFNPRTGLLENSWAEFTIPVHTLAKELDAETNASNNGNGNGNGNETSDRPPHKRRSSRVLSGLKTGESDAVTGGRKSTLHPLVQTALRLLASLKLLKIEEHEQTGEVIRSTNFTIINLWLVWFGPRREDRLAAELLVMQTLVGLVGLWIRHAGGRIVFGLDNK